MPLCQMGAAGPPVRSVHPVMRVVSQAIPVFLAGVVGYALYAVADFVLMEQFFRTYHQPGLALGFLIPYAILAALVVACYLRTYFTILLDPGTFPLGDESARHAFTNRPMMGRRRRSRPSRGGTGSQSDGVGCSILQKGAPRNKIGVLHDSNENDRNSNNSSSSASTAKAPLRTEADGAHGAEVATADLESGLTYSLPYSNSAGVGGLGSRQDGRPHFTHTPRPGDGGAPDPPAPPPHPQFDPDSPGLELFYTKDVFECGPDGRPLWCSQCAMWKPDRTHHCSEINRCVRKMDHYCPWVGGIVSETSFKFFVQFNFYATLLSALSIAACAYAIWQRNAHAVGGIARIVVMLVFACVLGLFAFAMTVTCTHFVFANVTTVESHQLKTRQKTMAVRVRRGSPPVEGRYGVVTYPLANEDATTGGTVSPPMMEPTPAPPASEQPAGAEAAAAQDSFAAAQQARAARRAARDQLACRTFAIVPVARGINVWDLGWRQNWVSVMGTNVADWLLPLRSSPCCDHEATAAASHSFYRLSPQFRTLCAQLELPPCPEMEQVGHAWG